MKEYISLIALSISFVTTLLISLTLFVLSDIKERIMRLESKVLSTTFFTDCPYREQESKKHEH